MNGDIYVGRKVDADVWDVELHLSYANKRFTVLPDIFKTALGMIAGGHDGIGEKLRPEEYHPDRHQDVYKIKVTPELVRQWFELNDED